MGLQKHAHVVAAGQCKQRWLKGSLGIDSGRHACLARNGRLDRSSRSTPGSLIQCTKAIYQ